MRVVLILLCSGLFHFIFALNRLRSFNASMTKYTWSVQVAECNKTDGSLVTLFDEEDANFSHKYLNDIGKSENFWLGLKKKQPTQRDDSSKIPVKDVLCEAIADGYLRNYSCSERKPFMCYKDDNYTLIENKKDWCQALQHCRTFYNGMVNSSYLIPNDTMIEKSKNSSFWIGVRHDEWEWQDKSCSTFRTWAKVQQPGSEDKECTVYDGEYPPLYIFDCAGVTAYSFCSKGTVRIKVIETPLPWEQAYNYCKANHTGMLWIEDGNDQMAVEQWLNYADVAGPFWIGLRQSRVFGTWIWASNKLVTYSKWEGGHHPELPLSNHCGVIHKPKMTWSDENCWVPRPFLCEEDIVYLKNS